MNKITLINADVLAGLAMLPDESVQCVVTSPPYWGLRDYGLDPVVWGGEIGCGHEWGNGIIKKGITGGHNQGGKTDDINGCTYIPSPDSSSNFCRLCGAWKGSYGLEPTIELYVEHTVQIFREVRRVLRKDGVLFLNLGDSYAREGGKTPGVSRHWDGRESDPGGQHDKRALAHEIGLKPKDLCGIPWRVALALQADGWWLRSDIIWSKPNPMPESCTDRPTKAHEYIFLLTKSAKYFYDAEAVREESGEKMPYGGRPDGKINNEQCQGKHGKSSLHRAMSREEKMKWYGNGRNLRSVWTIATAPFPQAHFATFPPAIPERCIKAGTSEKGCCPKCGAPWERVVEKELKKTCNAPGKGGRQIVPGSETSPSSCFRTGLTPKFTTTGWTPTCKCGFYSCPTKCTQPTTVLDVFSGAGTTALVAAKLGRDAIGIELSPEYVEMSRKRIVEEMGMLCEVEVK